MRKNGLLIAIDGTAGTGKSSVGKAVALKLGYSFLSTGEMYRALGYKVTEMGVSVDNTVAVTKVAEELVFTFERQPDASLKMFVDGEYLGEKLHTDSTGQAASKTSAIPTARAILTNKQREVGNEGGIIMEGRDIGTVVFPDADVKIYIDASAEVRAQRRFKQLQEKGESVDFDDLLESIKARDLRDSTRSVAPLKPAVDAVIVDTSNMTLEEVVSKVLSIIDGKK
ncbi:cytidylate kinase [Elusimicrobium posterum]|uniref:(d)CMP kinase n=1 Tax=Elusimicrobium posterum TaxID=3116653 RepID=UPI003C74F8E6